MGFGGKVGTSETSTLIRRGVLPACAGAVPHIGNDPTSGLEVPADSYWRFFADFFIYFRMPLFAFISGYVYASKPFAGQASRFLAGKTRRLLLPLFIVGTSFALVEWLVPGTM